jgi:hypothetical protein
MPHHATPLPPHATSCHIMPHHAPPLPHRIVPHHSTIIPCYAMPLTHRATSCHFPGPRRSSSHRRGCSSTDRSRCMVNALHRGGLYRRQRKWYGCRRQPWRRRGPWPRTCRFSFLAMRCSRAHACASHAGRAATPAPGASIYIATRYMFLTVTIRVPQHHSLDRHWSRRFHTLTRLPHTSHHVALVNISCISPSVLQSLPPPP